MSKSRISDKIRKLLAIVEDPSASEAEKAAALSKAAALARDHDLNIDDCAESVDTYRCESVARFRRLPPCHDGLAYVLATFFSVRILTTRTRYDDGQSDIQIEIFGSESNRAVAVYVWTYLKREFMWRFREWKRKHGRVTAKAERGFYEGLAFGLIARMREEQRQAPNENGLIVASRELDRRMNEELGHVPTRKPLDSELSYDAYRQGREIEIRRGVRSAKPEPKAIGCTTGLRHR